MTKKGYGKAYGTQFFTRSPSVLPFVFPTAANGYTATSDMGYIFTPKSNIHTMDYYHFIDASMTFIPRAFSFSIMNQPSTEELFYMKVAEDGKMYPITETINNPYKPEKTVSTAGTYFEFVDPNDMFELGTYGRNTETSVKLLDGSTVTMNLYSDYLCYVQKEFSTFEDMNPIEYEFGIKCYFGEDIIEKILTPYSDSYIHAYNSGGSVANYYTNMTASVSKPDDYHIEPGTSIIIDSTISSVTEDEESLPWYGTFQVKKEGSDEWVDLDPNFMDATTDNTKPTFNLKTDASYKNAQIRYKYVFSMDVGEDESNLLYGPASTIFMPIGIIYDGNHADSGSVKDQADYYKGDNAKINNNGGKTPFIRKGYRFVGWNTKADGSGHPYDGNEVVTLNSDMVLYAVWEKIESPALKNHEDINSNVTKNANNMNADRSEDTIHTKDKFGILIWIILMVISVTILVIGRKKMLKIN